MVSGTDEQKEAMLFAGKKIVHGLRKKKKKTRKYCEVKEDVVINRKKNRKLKTVS